MTKIVAGLAVIAFVVGCQPTPAPSARETSSASTSQTPPGSAETTSSSTTNATSPEPASPFASDTYESRVIDDAVEGFAAGLVDQYDGATDAGLARLFTGDGLASAMALDWRLRGAVRQETWFRGKVSVRGYSTTREEGLARPPLLETNIGFVVASGAELIDAATGSVLQRWWEPQYFTMLVALRYDGTTGEWRATAVSPALDWNQNEPHLTDAVVRCPGLGPIRRKSADPAAGRTWCFGGVEGILAVPAQVTLHTNVPCGETRASVLSLGWPIGSAIDYWDLHDFVRDPVGEFDERWPLPEPYVADETLPADAYSTGLTDGEFEIFVSPAAGPTAIWVRHRDIFERWPRAGAWGVTDCN